MIAKYMHLYTEYIVNNHVDTDLTARWLQLATKGVLRFFVKFRDQIIWMSYLMHYFGKLKQSREET